MSDLPQSKLPDSDMQSAPRALLRAAQRAREVARATRTGLVVVQDGEIVEIPYDQIEDIPASDITGFFDETLAAQDGVDEDR